MAELEHTYHRKYWMEAQDKGRLRQGMEQHHNGQVAESDSLKWKAVLRSLNIMDPVRRTPAYAASALHIRTHFI